MELEVLVQSITREVLKQLQLAPASPQVLILSERDSANVPLILQQLGADTPVFYWAPGCRHPAVARVILPLLSCSQMSDLALGRAGDPIMERVLSTLLCGGGVEIFEYEYVRYRDTAPQRLFELYATYEDTLRSFGLKPFASGTTNGARLNQSLVTERDIIEAHKRGDMLLHVRSDAKLTPLALDCARERGVQIQTMEG